MKKQKKVLALVLCAVMLVASSVLATMAYLTSTTEVVKNTFTVGNVAITLDETDVDLYGAKDGETRVTENTYKLIPGHSYVKDPIVHVTKGSEAAYVFVKIVDEIAAIEDTATVAAQMEANGWKAVAGENNVYVYNAVVDARKEAVDVAVFSTFKVKGEADVVAYEGKKIDVQAYAVQADGFADAAAAWTAAKAEWDF